MDLAAELGERFQHLVKDEIRHLEAHEALLTSIGDVATADDPNIAKSNINLNRLANERIKTTRELLAIQQQLGVCNVCRF